MNNFDRTLSQHLKVRKDKGLLRSLQIKKDLIDFTSNDYLGLARSPELHALILNKTSERKANGATGSRLLSGDSEYCHEVEHKLSKIFKSETTLIFNSGYTANVSILSSLPRKGDTIIYDELAHASIKDGARLSLGTRFSFKHNNLEDLELKIKKCTGKIYVVVESFYSMDGDECPLQELVRLTDKYNAFLILDEAHSTGIDGNMGSGLATKLNLQTKIAVRIHTFGKAMGTHGACVAGSQVLRDYLINFARPFIYTTALPVHTIISIDCAFQFLSRNLHLQDILKKKVSLFLQNLSPAVDRTPSNGAIQTVVIPGNDQVKKAALTLQENSLDVRPILSPTIPAGSERLRICLHTFNSDEEILKLTSIINEMTQGNT